MRKLRNGLAVALFTFAVTVNASALITDPADGLNPARPVAGTCYIYLMGMWWAYPC
jgi:hypothetical protein